MHRKAAVWFLTPPAASEGHPGYVLVLPAVVDQRAAVLVDHLAGDIPALLTITSIRPYSWIAPWTKASTSLRFVTSA